MIIKRHLEDLRGEDREIVLAAGSFDGVHRGHQSLISYAVAQAMSGRGEAWLLTFDPHPSKVLRPENSSRLLTSTKHKLRILETLGLDGCLIIPFTRELSKLEPENFVSLLRGNIPRLQEMVVGPNWTFGHRAHGTPSLLRALGVSHGFGVHIAQPILYEDEPVSSTRIRQVLQEGDLDRARGMLGRPYSAFGKVVEGKQVGRELGYPTANIRADNEVLPPSGIYAGLLNTQGNVYQGAAYLGSAGRPDDPGRKDLVEIHLFDFEGDLYNQDVEVFFVKHIREDRRFESQDALKVQIGRDIEQIKTYLGTCHPSP